MPDRAHHRLAPAVIPRLKRQTKQRHSVLGGRKLFKRRLIRMVADRMAEKITTQLHAILFPPADD